MDSVRIKISLITILKCIFCVNVIESVVLPQDFHNVASTLTPENRGDCVYLCLLHDYCFYN